ncbi:hypothetical protein BH10BAC3_BH10BAC3_17260 [soil metagenome]
MLTVKQLAIDLEALQTGDCWLGYNASEILDSIDHNMAQVKGYRQGNSIWQIVNHIAFWRQLVARCLIEMKRIEGTETGMDAPATGSIAEWKQTLDRFNDSFEQLKTAILNFDESMLFQPVGGKGSYYHLITGSIQHDAFHLGQVMMLKRLALTS